MKYTIFERAAYFALLLGALFFFYRHAGSSPILWTDTFNDELEVQRCLKYDSCTLLGMQTSVPGQVHAVTWLELRTLLVLGGIGIEGTHRLMILLNALAIVLVYHVGRQLGGSVAGAFAVWLVAVQFGPQVVRLTALYNSSPLFFFGAVLLLACTAVVQRPGFVSVSLAALFAAFLANIHLACVINGASIVWVALFASRRRILLSLYAGAMVAAASMLAAPPSWLHDFASLLDPARRGGHGGGAVASQAHAIMEWASFAVGVWLLSFLAGSWEPLATYRRRIQGAIAVLLPFLAAFLVASRTGFRGDVKYLAHLQAACAVAAAVPIGLVANAILRQLPSIFGQRVAVFLPLLLGVWLGQATFTPFTAADEQTPTVADLDDTVRVLNRELNWSGAQILQRLRTPYGVPVLTRVWQLREGMVSPQLRDPVPLMTAELLVASSEELPAILPPGWRVLRSNPRSSVLLYVAPSRIDWEHYDYCLIDGEASRRMCDATGWGVLEDDSPTFRVPPMPDVGSRGTLHLRVPLRRGTPARPIEIYMPRLVLDFCGGRIVSESGPTMTVDADGRHATLLAEDEGSDADSSIELEWQLGSGECRDTVYDGVVPYFVEADVESARLIQAILRKKEL